MGRLGVSHHFDDIFDIVATDYIPKPQREAYDYVIDKTKLDLENAVMFEDLARNLEVPHQLGMTTVLVQAKGDHPDANLGVLGTGEEDHVHHVTDDLTYFLNDVVLK